MTEPNPARLRHRAEELSATLPPLLVAAERVAATVAQGVHGRRRVGQGETFWQFRRFELGDSAQQIDWRQSGKSEPIYVRETEWEAAQSVWIWVDHSASMDFRSERRLPSKVERARVLALALATLLVRGGERIALLDAEGRPGGGRGRLHDMASRLAQASSTGDSLPPARPLPQYAQIVLIGDFLEPLPDIDRALRALGATGCRGHVMQILDPAEESFPYDGRLRFEGLEDEGELIVRRARAMQEDYREAIGRQIAGLDAIVQTIGWSTTHHRSDHSPESALLALYMALSDALTRRR